MCSRSAFRPRLACVPPLFDSQGGNSHIHTLSGLQGSVRLITLWIDDCPLVNDLSPLTECVELVHLALRCTSVSSLKPLANCRALTHISFTNCTRVQRLDGLERLPRLTTIRASGVPLESIEGVSQMDSLQETHIDLSNAVAEASVTRMLGTRSAMRKKLRVLLDRTDVDGITEAVCLSQD